MALDRPYHVSLGAGTTSPANSTVYVIGLLPNIGWLNALGLTSLIVRQPCTVQRVDLRFRVASPGSAETLISTLVVNDVSTDVISASFTLDASTVDVSATLARPLNAGDRIDVAIQTPAWGTPPTGVDLRGSYLIAPHTFDNPRPTYGEFPKFLLRD